MRRLYFISLLLFLAPQLWADQVTIEPSNVVDDIEDRDQYAHYYSERRQRWGAIVSIGVGKPDFTNFNTGISGNAEFDEFYESNKDLLYDLNIVIKRNFKVLSLGLNLGAGYAKLSAKDDNIKTKLSLTPYRAGLVIALDNLWKKNPYVVPYIGGGAQMIKYKEEDKINETSESETSSLSYYYTGGLMFQLDWLDRGDSFESFFEAGIQNTFLFVEATKYIETDEVDEPNLGATVYSAGLKLEF